MSELGQVLQRAREEKGITLEEVARITKIQRRYLEAIDRGHFHVLPGHFYARAFIKSYAEAVGLDPAQLLSQYQSDLPVQPPQEQVERLRRRRVAAAKKPFPSGRWITQTLLVLFVLLVVGVIYTAFVNRDDWGAEPIPGSSVSQPDNITTPQVGPDAAPAPGPVDQSPSQGSGSGSAETPQTSPAPETPSTSPDEQPTLKLASQQGSTYRFTLDRGDKLVIKVKAVSGDCWIEVREKKGAKNAIGRGLLRKGQEQVYEASQTAYVVVGNPDAVEVTVNDAPINMADVTFHPSYFDISIESAPQG